MAVALACAGKGTAITLQQSFREALRTLALQLAGGKCEVPTWAERSEAVFGLLDESDRVVFRDQLYALLRENADTAQASFFDLFGEEISAGNCVQKDSSAATTVFERMFQSRNVAGFRWARSELEKDPNLLANAKLEHRQVFERALAVELRDGVEDEAHQQLIAIADILGVQVAAAQDVHEKPFESSAAD